MFPLNSGSLKTTKQTPHMPYVAIIWYLYSLLLSKKGPNSKGPFSQRALDTKFIVDTMYFWSGNRLEVVSDRFDKQSRHKKHLNVQKALKCAKGSHRGPYLQKMKISLINLDLF